MRCDIYGIFTIQDLEQVNEYVCVCVRCFDTKFFTIVTNQILCKFYLTNHSCSRAGSARGEQKAKLPTSLPDLLRGEEFARCAFPPFVFSRSAPVLLTVGTGPR